MVARFVRPERVKRERERAMADDLARLGEAAERKARQAAAAGDYETAYERRRLAIAVTERANSIYRAQLRTARAYVRTARAYVTATSTPAKAKPATAEKPKRDSHGRFARNHNGHKRRNGHKRAPAKRKRQPASQGDDPPPARPCYCEHPWPFADDIVGSRWVRCGACGHDVTGEAAS
jgi:hypothetical protein